MTVLDMVAPDGWYVDEDGVTQIGEGTYSPVYLHWIAALPQARVMPSSLAASRKLPSRAAASKAVSARRGGRSRLAKFPHHSQGGPF